jgi:transcriptional regulator with XRE-family HTH domain
MARVLRRTAIETPRIDLSDIRRNLGVSRERMARLLDVSAKTIERWEERGTVLANRTAIDRLSRLRDIADLGLQVYTPEAFHLFLTVPMPAFNGHSALQMIELGDVDLVYGEIVADYEGSGF